MFKKAIVMGLGTSGESAAGLLLKEGSEVTVIDAAVNMDLRRRAYGLRRKGALVLLGADNVPSGDFDVCIVSPGISSDSKWVRDVEARGTEVLSELELGASRCRCPMLAVTGSKGKSTMVKFCADALKTAGKRVAIAGNYGPPLCGAALKSGKLDWIVVEVSSFQLEKVRMFRPRVGVLLNIQPDHLNRHGNMQCYRAMKSRLFGRMKPADCGIVLQEDIPVIKRLSGGRNRWISFGVSSRAGYRYREGRICFRDGGRKRVLDVRGTMFSNDVLGLAAAAAAAAVRACGVDPVAVEKAARSFKPLPHRMQLIAMKKGVRFVNDSKATNLAALAAGVRMCDGPVRLIAGGLLKESNLNSVKKILVKRVSGVYLIGKASREMEKAWGSSVKCRKCGTLDKAVRLAWNDAREGETVILSPACASFDQFKNFEDRGSKFSRIVKSITEGVER